METIDNFLFGENVCAGVDRAEHIKKHGFDMTPGDIIEFADKVTEGVEGVHVCFSPFGQPVTIVIRGFIEMNGKKYGITRTIWDDDAGSRGKNERTGIPVLYHPEIDWYC